MNERITRRALLRGGVAAGALGVLSTGSSTLWLAADAHADADGIRPAADPLLVVIFLRGGADGLHLLAPLGDPDYRGLRDDLALSTGIPIAPVAKPSIGHDPRFHLHPAFAPLAAPIGAGRLAAFHMTGSPESSRSHFEAQDRMEMGLGGEERPTTEGWLTRALAPTAAPSGPDPFSLLALAGAAPQTIRGAGAFAIDEPGSFGLPLASGQARRALLSMYEQACDGETGDDAALGRAGVRALAALQDFEARVGPPSNRRRRGRRGPASLERRIRELETLLGAGLPVQAAFVEGDGWDSHRGQGNETGAVARRIDDLAKALAALDVLRTQRPVRTVVMTEFGRTAARNGSGGTDHGHGGVMLVAGADVRGGVHGRWTGLARGALFDGRDLPVHTDYRDVLGAVVARHLGKELPPATFPGHGPSPIGLFA